MTHRFVDLVPDELEDGVLYVSTKYVTVTHKCCCGCGEEVVTPLSPTDWTLTFDGKTVSLHPSIGNWDLPCRSHYWIRRGRVHWAERWSQEEIEAGRDRDRRDAEEFFQPESAPATEAVASGPPRRRTLWQVIASWWARIS